MRILSIMWSSYLPLLSEAAHVLGIELTAYSTKQIKREPELVSRIASEIDKADLVLLYRTSDDFWEELEQTVLTVKDRVPVVVVGPEPSFSALSNVNPEIVATVYKYILFGGAGNMRNMLGYLLSNLFEETVTFEAPEPLPWEGIHHPAIPGVFPTTADFLSAYQGFLSSAPSSFVGLLFSRSNWVTRNLEVEAALISALEARGLGVIPVFYYSLKDDHLGNMSGVEVVEHFLMEDKPPASTRSSNSPPSFSAASGAGSRNRTSLGRSRSSSGWACPSLHPSSRTIRTGDSGSTTLRGSAARWRGALPCPSSKG